MKAMDSVIELLFMELTKKVEEDMEYVECQCRLTKKLEQLAKENGQGSMIDAYFKDVLDGKVENTDNLTKDLAEKSTRGTTLIEVEDAILTSETAAINIVIREAFLHGISFCNQVREFNLNNL